MSHFCIWNRNFQFLLYQVLSRSDHGHDAGGTGGAELGRVVTVPTGFARASQCCSGFCMSFAVNAGFRIQCFGKLGRRYVSARSQLMNLWVSHLWEDHLPSTVTEAAHSILSIGTSVQSQRCVCAGGRTWVGAPPEASSLLCQGQMCNWVLGKGHVARVPCGASREMSIFLGPRCHDSQSPGSGTQDQSPLWSLGTQLVRVTPHPSSKRSEPAPLS